MFPLMDLSQQFQNTLLTSDHEEEENVGARWSVQEVCPHYFFE